MNQAGTTGLARVYRAAGADPPGGDPRRAHGVEMEGWFWRFSDPASGRVAIALVGICQAAGGAWAAAAGALHPGTGVWAQTGGWALASRDRFSVDAAPLLRGDAETLAVRLDGFELDASFADRRDWPLRRWGGLGPAHWIPGLGQYWHPHLLGAEVRGRLRAGGEELSLDGWRVYGEKNWGRGFPTLWWWGQAQGFGDGGDACLAFAGGRLPGMPGRPTATAIVLALDGRTLRFGAPTALVSARAEPGAWHLRAATALHRLEVVGEARTAPHRLPVPIPAEHRTEPWAAQHLAGRVEVTLHRGRRLLWRGESQVAGLEYGSARKGSGTFRAQQE